MVGLQLLDFEWWIVVLAFVLVVHSWLGLQLLDFEWWAESCSWIGWRLTIFARTACTSATEDCNGNDCNCPKDQQSHNTKAQLSSTRG
jgi:hypothetical protein